jgi:hypothetical protein
VGVYASRIDGHECDFAGRAIVDTAATLEPGPEEIFQILHGRLKPRKVRVTRYYAPAI